VVLRFTRLWWACPPFVWQVCLPPAGLVPDFADLPVSRLVRRSFNEGGSPELTEGAKVDVLLKFLGPAK